MLAQIVSRTISLQPHQKHVDAAYCCFFRKPVVHPSHSYWTALQAIAFVILQFTAPAEGGFFFIVHGALSMLPLYMFLPLVKSAIAIHRFPSFRLLNQAS